MPDHRPAPPIIDFRSDNTGRAAPEIIAALAAANEGTAAGYGGDEWTALLQRRFGELFETTVRVFPVATGTAANALALAALSPPWGAGRIDPDAFARTLASVMPGQLHRGQPAAVNLTQASDLGTVYALDEIRAIADIAKTRGLKVHMDGARFANALARLGCSPAEMTWRSGIDILSFGATKNGGALCDAIVVFAPELADSLSMQLRRAGQVWSKMRFAAAQLLAYVEDGLYLRNARQANDIAARIAGGLRDLPGVVPLAPIEANEVFLQLPASVLDGLEADGVRFFRRPGDIARFVCRFDATPAEADALLASLRRHLGATR